MKKIMLLSISMFFTLILLSQTLGRLDRIHGYRKFKLGDNISSFSNLKFEVIPIKLNGVKNYVYTGKDITDFYGVHIEEITLSFFRNRLYQISASFGNVLKEYSVEQFDLVQTNLEANFGKDYREVSPAPEAEVLNGAIWDARVVRLENLRLRFPGDSDKDHRYNHIEGYILFTDKQIQQEQQNSEIEN